MAASIYHFPFPFDFYDLGEYTQKNHDTCSPHPYVDDKEIFKDKMLAYSFILTHPGYPCIFWRDYYDFNLAQTGNKSGIDALILIHEQYAGGTAEFTPLAWRGKDDLNIPKTLFTDDNCNGDFWAPPRGYTVYVPVG